MKDEAAQQFVVFLSTIFSAVAAVASGPTGAADDLWDNSRFVNTCILGCLAGSILMIGLPHARMTAKKMACESAFSFLCGLVFAPAFIEHYSIPKTATWVVPASALVSMVALGILRLVIPLLKMLVVDAIINRALKAFGFQPIAPPEQKPTEKLEP